MSVGGSILQHPKNDSVLMLVGDVVRWGGGVTNPHLVSCAFYMLSFEKYAGRYNSCRKHGWGGDTQIVLVFTGLQSA